LLTKSWKVLRGSGGEKKRLMVSRRTANSGQSVGSFFDDGLRLPGRIGPRAPHVISGDT